MNNRLHNILFWIILRLVIVLRIVCVLAAVDFINRNLFRFDKSEISKKQEIEEVNQELNNTLQDSIIQITIWDIPNDELNDSLMLEGCKACKIKYPYIVTAQAILESGHFKSDIYKTKNNPLGLYNSKQKAYWHFDDWQQSIFAYIDLIEYRYYDNNEDYYHFLKRIGYATDPDYIKKVQRIEKILKEKYPP